MNKKEFAKLINKNKYQVFLFTCTCRFPINFARHPWFVINNKGKISRWEILKKVNQCKTSWKHLHLNLHEPTESLKNFSAIDGNSKLVKFITGDINSTAYKMIKLIESSPIKYKFNNNYSLTGPNSNSYAQWILNHFKEFRAKLPFNSFGKGYKKNL